MTRTRTYSFTIIALLVITALCVNPLIASGAVTFGSLNLISKGPTPPGTGGNNHTNNQTAPSISADGTKVVFSTQATNLIGGGTTGVQVFCYDYTTDTTILLSRNSAGTSANNASQYPTISADGTRVAFQSLATDLVGAPASGGFFNIFVCNADGTGTIRLVTAGVGTGVNGQTRTPSISADGTKIAFVSQASNLIPTALNGNWQVFVWNATGPTTTLVSVGAGAGGNAESANPSISGDGTRIAYDSYATNLVSPVANGVRNVFLWNAGTTTLVSKGIGAGANGGTSASSNPSISRDGSAIAFQSTATNLTAVTPPSHSNIYRYVIAGPTTTLVTAGSNGASVTPSISGDGMLIAFSTYANNLVSPPIDNNNFNISNIFVHDVSDSTNLLLSVGDGARANNNSTFPAISASGNAVSFISLATNLLDAPANGYRNVFLTSLGEPPIPDDVTVTFDGMGGTTPSPQTIPPGTTATDPGASVRAGFRFLGWYTAETGGTLWNFGDPVPESMTLYAHWAELFSVTYLPGTIDAVGNMPANQLLAYIAGDIVTIPTNVPTRSGYTFEGWTVTGISPSDVVDGKFTMPDGNVVFTAVWKKIQTPPPGPDGKTPPTGDVTAFVPLITLAIIGSAMTTMSWYRRKDQK